jgi:hypothetical protein
MGHLKDRDILDRLAAADEGDAECGSHLETCPHCRQRFEDFRRTWQLLGRWDLQPESGELVPRVLQATRDEPEGRPWPGRLRTVIRPLAGAAAVVVFATLAGFVAGHNSRTREDPESPPYSAASTQLDAKVAMLLDVLGSEPVGLTAPLLSSGLLIKETP